MLERLRVRLAWFFWFFELPPVLDPRVRRYLSANQGERLRTLQRLNDRWLDREPRVDLPDDPDPG